MSSVSRIDVYLLSPPFSFFFRLALRSQLRILFLEASATLASPAAPWDRFGMYSSTVIEGGTN